MTSDAEPARTSIVQPTILARLPTGAKLFLILSAALLPLALIAIVATFQTSRVADAEARARLRVAADESARAIAIELVGDMTSLRSAVKALTADRGDAPSCARIQGVFAQQAVTGTRFVITDAAGRPLCGTPLPVTVNLPNENHPIVGTIAEDDGLVLGLNGPPGTPRARAFFPRSFLAKLGAPSSRAIVYSQTLTLGDNTLVLEDIPGVQPFDRMETMQTDIGIADLTLRTSIRSAPITSSLVVAMLLPLLMWAAAVGISWFVVDHLLIRPLRRLRRDVADYTPGEVIDPGKGGALPAQEIRELGDTFRAISHTVALHEAGLAEGLIRQTKLTREVHHRVKNNLQVISSLINFHARGAPTPEAVAAYASIQRRVDALAVVHRNHFAEMEDNRGLNLRSVLGELASNIRATAPDEAHGLSIVLDVDPYMVNQDVAVAVAFLVTETIELAMSCDHTAQIRVAVKSGDVEGRALLRVISRSLVESDDLRDFVQRRYGRVMEGLSRQLRSKLHHDPLTGAYEISVAVVGHA